MRTEKNHKNATPNKTHPSSSTRICSAVYTTTTTPSTVSIRATAMKRTVSGMLTRGMQKSMKKQKRINNTKKRFTQKKLPIHGHHDPLRHSGGTEMTWEPNRIFVTVAKNHWTETEVSLCKTTKSTIGQRCVICQTNGIRFKTKNRRLNR